MRKQVQTGKDKGPAKLQLQARGPYRVLEVLSEDTYLIHRLPFQEGDGQVGNPYKEKAARMEKLPSKLVIDKHPTGVDANWATFRHAFAPAPLQHTLGAFDYGQFTRSNSTTFAYQPIHELWE